MRKQGICTIVLGWGICVLILACSDATNDDVKRGSTNDPTFVALRDQVIPAVMQMEVALLRAGVGGPVGLTERFTAWHHDSAGCLNCADGNKPGDKTITSWGSDNLGGCWTHVSGACSDWNDLCAGWLYNDSGRFRCALLDSIPMIDSTNFVETCSLHIDIVDNDSLSVGLTVNYESRVDRSSIASATIGANTRLHLQGTVRNDSGLLTQTEFRASCLAENVEFDMPSLESAAPCPRLASFSIDLSENLSAQLQGDSEAVSDWKIEVTLINSRAKIIVSRDDTCWDYTISDLCDWPSEYDDFLGALMRALRLRRD